VFWAISKMPYGLFSWRVPSYWSEMDVKVDLLGDLLGAIPRVMCKVLARDEEGDLVVQEYIVEAVFTTFYGRS
jgi:hypothetical protein